MASGSINLNGSVKGVSGRIDWQSYANQAGNYSDVNVQVYVINSGYGIQGTGAGQWKENGNTVNTFSPYINVPYAGYGTTKVFTKNGIRVNHNENGDASIQIGADMQFNFAGVSNVGGSGWIGMDHIDRYAKVSNSERGKTINTISINWNSDVPRDWTQYSLNDQAWTNASDTVASNGKSGYYTVSNLEPNKQYKIRTRIRRQSNGLWSEASNLWITTYNYAIITEAPNITIGNNAKIKYSNPSGASIEVSLYQNSNKTIAGYRKATGNNYTFNFTSDEINRMYRLIPNDLKVSLRYYIETTQNGKSYWDYAERTFSINQSISKPNFSGGISYENINEKVLSLTGNSNKFIKKFSDLKISIDKKATPKNSASISKYYVTDGRRQINIPITSTLPYVANMNAIDSSNLETYAVDSRGLSDSQTKTLDIINYFEPLIESSTSLKRVGGVQTSVYFNFKGKIWKNNFGKKENSLLSFKYKKILSTTNNWDSASWVEVPKEKYSVDINGNIINAKDSIISDFEVGKEFLVKFRIEDELSYNEYITKVSSGEPIMAWNKQKKLVGVGKIPKKDLIPGSIDVLGDICNKGNPIILAQKKEIYVQGDANTYYPVLISIDHRWDLSPFRTNLINISRRYDEEAPDSWNSPTHKGGLTLTILWNGDYYWGGNTMEVRVLGYSETYTTMVGGINRSTYGLVVWLRGGGAIYYLDSEYGQFINYKIYLEGFTDRAKNSFMPRKTIDSSFLEKRLVTKEEVYPVGSVYMSFKSTSPASLFGGTWEQLKGRFLLGVGTAENNNSSFYGDINRTSQDYWSDSGSTAGQFYHTLTVNEMPSHDHNFAEMGRVMYWDAGLSSMGGLTSGSAVQVTWSSNTKTTGGSQKHNNMPPFITVYMWKRTA